MNFPPILFYNQNFSSLFTNNNNQKSANLLLYQNLCKKLLKFENKDTSFQSNAINWIKSLEIQQLIKYCSFKNKWFVDILHEMILISNSKQDINYKFIKACDSDEQKENQSSNLNSYINYLYYQKECPRFTYYFFIDDEGLISLNRRKTPEEKLKKNFIDNIRYITLSRNSLININIRNKEKSDDIFYEINNVVTLSFDYLTNIDKLIEVFNIISNKQFCKNPIEIDIKISKSGKNYYNFQLPKWIGDKFTLSELLCAYFEQSLLINFQYYILYKQEISFLYYDELGEFLENINKLKEFINNSKDNIQIFQSAKPDEIKKIFNDNQYIKKIISDKKKIEDDIRNSYIGKISYSKKHTIKTIINTTLTSLEDIFIHDKLNFVIFITFIKDSIIYTTEDFIIKIVYDIINNYWKSKVSEDLINEIESNNNENNKKRKKKKKKKKEGKEEKEEKEVNKDIDQDNNKFNNINENNKDIIIENLNTFSEKNRDIISNLDNPQLNVNKNEDLKENKDSKYENMLIEDKKLLNKNLIEDIEKKINNVPEENKEKFLDNNNIANNHKLEKENNIKTMKEADKNKINNDNNKYDFFKNELNKDDSNSENNQKNKKEKNFFLYPTFKDKKKKNKFNKINEKNLYNNFKEDILDKNQFNEINGKTNLKEKDLISNEKKIFYNRNDIKIEEEEKKENLINNKDIINKNNNSENKEKYIKNKTGYEYPSSKQKNKFNKGIKLKNILSENSYIIIPKHFQPHDNNYNKLKFKKYEKEDIYEKNKNLENIDFNEHFIKNVFDFNHEIILNTLKVKENVKILENIRKKIIIEIFEKINFFLNNEKVIFRCSFYGSCFCGLAIENSDVDIMVKLRENKNENDYVKKIMNILVDKFNQLKNNNNQYIRNIFPIFSASVPVIKLECGLCNIDSLSNDINDLIKNGDLDFNEVTKLYFDITFFLVKNEEEKIPSELIIDYIQENTITFPQIIDIVYIMKRFLFNRKLNKSYQGGISSYSLFLITLAFIKFYKNNNEVLTSVLLIDFLIFYLNFDFFNNAIRPNESIDIYSTIEKDSDKYKVNIIDPITKINVAKSTYKIELIQNAFREGLDIIIRNLYEVDNENNNNNKKILYKFLSK